MYYLFKKLFFVFFIASTCLAVENNDFRLIDQFDNSHLASYYSDYKYVAVIALQPTCQRNLQNKARLEKELRELEAKKIAKFFYLDITNLQKRKNLVDLSKKLSIETPILLDSTQMISKGFSFQFDGDMVLLDPVSTEITYRGSIKDINCMFDEKGILKKDKCRETVFGKFLNQVSDTLFGKCDLNYLPGEKLTYTKDIARIVEYRCVFCHLNDDFGEFTSYEKIVHWSSMIESTIRTMRMPPGGRDIYYGDFKFSHKDDELRKILQWIKNGHKRGEGEDILLRHKGKTKSSFVVDNKVEDFFKYNKPDIIIKQKEADVIPASGILEYQYSQLAGPLKDDIYVQAVKYKYNDRVIHHATLFTSKKPINKKRTRFVSGMVGIKKNLRVISKSSDAIGNSELIEEFASEVVGKGGRQKYKYPSEVVLKIPKGSYLNMEYHYNPTGRKEVNQATIFLYLRRDKKSAKVLHKFVIKRDRFTIAPNQKHYKIVSKLKVDRAMNIMKLRPHLHYRGKSVKYSVILPDKTKKVILNVPYYQFKFQPVHILKKPVYIPKNSFLETEVVYDNSENNFQNPDSTIYVPLGNQTYQSEMHSLYFFAYYDDKE